ncbi:MAG: ADP-ribosylglycohydrolase [Desulforhopalus sp.]
MIRTVVHTNNSQMTGCIVEIIKNKKKGMLFGAFYGDAFALGPHWIYDTQKIVKTFGQIKTLTPPPPTYHSSKRKGDFTHYGDQALVLLQSVNSMTGFDLKDFKNKWRALFDNYQGYVDGATKQTLKNIAAGIEDPVGSASQDLAGASRIAPLIYFYDDSTQLMAAVEAQTSLTHNNATVMNTAFFFAALTMTVLQGGTVKDALYSTLETVEDENIRRLIERGAKEAGQESVQCLQKFGTACSVEQSLPGTIQILLTYPEDYMGAMTANVMSGGDSAARGALIGMVLGAASPLDESYFKEMNSYDMIRNLI